MRELFLIANDAQNKYTLKRINHELDRRAFIIASARAYQIYNQYIDYTYGVDVTISKLQKHLLESTENKFTRHLFANPRKYYNLAFEQTIDLLKSLQTRFITGGSAEYYINYLINK